MSPGTDEYRRTFALLEQALELPAGRREAFLSEAGGDDPELLERVRALLAAGSDEGREDAFAERSVEATRRAFEEVLDEAEAPWLPEKIGGFAIVRRIGQGGMGIVYEATQQAPRRSVALKLLHPIQATPDRLRRFQREVELLGRLQHPGIAQIHEAGTYDVGRGPQPFFAMELVEGVDLRTYCARRGQAQPATPCASCEVGVACPRTCAALVELLASICDAVHFAHEQGVVHRDLKPENVLIDRQGRPRVLDFGVARAIDSGTRSTFLTEQGQVVGTLAYMAPELLNESEGAVTPLVDVYALGVMGFELLTGRLPHEVGDLSLTRAIAVLASSDPPLAGRLDPALKGDLETILAKALDPEPRRRYASAGALAADLRRSLAHRPIEARPPSRTYLVRKFARRHRGLTAGALATFFTLVAGIVVALLLARQAREQRDDAKAQRELARGNEARAIGGTLQSAELLIEAGRERDALAQLALVPPEARGAAWRLLDRMVPFVLDEESADWRFLDDEHLVGVVGETLVVYSLIERRRVREGFRGLGLRHVERAAPCGLVVAQTSAHPEHVELATDEVLLLDLEREAVVRRAPFSVTGQWRWPETSDDGRSVLWYTSASEAEVTVDGQVVHVVEGLSESEAAHLGPDGRFLAVNRRAEVTVLDLTTGALRFRHVPAPGAGASGFPVRGGVLLHSSWEAGRPDGPQVWRRFDLDHGAALLEPADPFASGFSVEPVHHLFTYSRDGRIVAAREDRGGVKGAYLGSTETGLPLERAGLTRDGQGLGGFLEFPEALSLIVQLSPSGSRILTGGWERGRIVELEPASAAPGADPRARTLRGHTDATDRAGSGWIYHLAVSHDGSLIASSAPADPLVRVWDARTGETVATLRRDCGVLHDTNPGSWESLMAFGAGDDRLLLTTPYGGLGLCLVDWNLETGEVVLPGEPLAQDASHLLLLDRFLEQLAPVGDVRLSQRVQVSDGAALVAFEPPTPGLRGMSRPPQGARWRYVPGVEGHAQGLSVHPSLPRAAVVEQVGGLERAGRLTVVDTETGAVVAQRALSYMPWCVAYSPDGAVLAIGTNTGHVLLFETERTTRQLVWRAHEGLSSSYVYSLAWTPDGTRLVTASGDETLKIWDTRTRVASHLDEVRWQELRAGMAARRDLDLAGLAGREREAARVERMLRLVR